MRSPRWRPTIDADTPYWSRLSMMEMDSGQWEALCDQCGRCCVQRIEREDQIIDTCLACRLYDVERGGCADYDNRFASVPECVQLCPTMAADAYRGLPPSCAYRRLAEGRGLPSWHPLLTGDPDSGRRAAGIAPYLIEPPRGAGSVRLEDYTTVFPKTPC